jgi:protein CpxP
MKRKEVLMSQLRKPLMVAGLLAGFGFAAIAQTPAAPTPGAMSGMSGMHERGERHDPAKMKEHMAKRQAELKAKLKITPAQEGAWSTFTASMQPPANRPAHPSREDMAKLTTPERIDRMQAMKTERDARMSQRAASTKTFYAALSPEQQKVFDANTMRKHHEGHGMHKG